MLVDHLPVWYSGEQFHILKGSQTFAWAFGVAWFLNSTLTSFRYCFKFFINERNLSIVFVSSASLKGANFPERYLASSSLQLARHVFNFEFMQLSFPISSHSPSLWQNFVIILFLLRLFSMLDLSLTLTKLSNTEKKDYRDRRHFVFPWVPRHIQGCENAECGKIRKPGYFRLRTKRRLFFVCTIRRKPSFSIPQGFISWRWIVWSERCQSMVGKTCTTYPKF